MKNARYFFAVVLMGFLFIGNNVYASFPVETAKSEVVNDEASVDENTGTLSSPASTLGGDVMWIAAVLWFVLGGFAAHRWYAGKPVGWNILFILTFSGLGVWWLIDGIMIFTGSFLD